MAPQTARLAYYRPDSVTWWEWDDWKTQKVK